MFCYVPSNAIVQKSYLFEFKQLYKRFATGQNFSGSVIASRRCSFGGVAIPFWQKIFEE